MQGLRVLLMVASLVPGLLLMAAGWFWLGLLIHVLPVALILWGTFRPASQLFGKKILRSSGGVSLTLDDGPDPETTPEILELLEEAGVRATFFLIGEKAARHPELVRAIAARGHLIGNHSFSHPHASFWAVGPRRAEREVTRCQEVLGEILGSQPQLFRPPVGHCNPFIHPVLKRRGLLLVGWSCRGFDGVSRSREQVRESLARSLSADAIVLAHESTPIAAEVVQDILALVAERGWSFAEPDFTDVERR